MRPFVYFHLGAGSRRIVVDGIEPMDVPGDYIQPYIFDDLYRKTIHRDSETLGMEICMPVWKHRAFIDAHRYDHAAVTTLLLVTTEETQLEHLIARKVAGGRRRRGGQHHRGDGQRAGRATGSAASLCVVKHRGSAKSDEIAEYRVTERGSCSELRSARPRGPDRAALLEAPAPRALPPTRRALRIRSERAALAFVEAVGLCSTFHRFPEGVACLWEAVVGRAAPRWPRRSHHDDGIGLTWELKDVLPARRQVYYGKLVKGRPLLVALDLFPAFYALVRGRPARARLPRPSTRRAASRSTAKRIMDSLVRESPQYTRGLRAECFMLEPAQDARVRAGHGRAPAGALDRQDRGALRADLLLPLGPARAVAARRGRGRPAPRAAPAALERAARALSGRRGLLDAGPARPALRPPAPEVEAAVARLRRAGRVRAGVEVAGWPGRWVVSA